ncbi:DUF2066 domain-containing protein [Halioxenophilus aromaticivorans]|uniref:DUF2066 domain-containing protein n=1 Tax=Halioxenophilus aromaticivorans TaxID=1306992 RepID=A0AAV3TZF0_9ALTE
MGKIKFGALAVIACLSVWLAASHASAETRLDLYSAKVEIADRTAATRGRVLSQALAQVLVKVTGSRLYLENPLVVEALEQSSRYLQAYSYTTLPPNITYLQARFGPSTINNLLSEADIPVWPANRPEVLVWLVMKDYQTGTALITPESFTDPESPLAMLQQLQESATAVGLPIALPTREFTASDDSAAGTGDNSDIVRDPQSKTEIGADEQSEVESFATGISARTLWALDMPAIEQVSQGYGADSILVGRVAKTSSGSWRIGWRYQQGSRSEVFDSSDLQFDVALADGLSEVTRYLSSIYSVSASRADGEPTPAIITGIDSFKSYANAVNYLDGLAALSHYDIQAVDGDTLVLTFYINGDYRSLTTALALDRQLQPVANDTAVATAPAVQLLWVGD